MADGGRELRDWVVCRILATSVASLGKESSYVGAMGRHQSTTQGENANVVNS